MIEKNTSEDFVYLPCVFVNPSVTLNAKDSSATCKARIKGAN